MNIQKIIVLAGILILPTQELLAGNARELAQPSANKSAASAPAKATSNMKIVTPIRQGNVSADPVATSGPATVQKPTLSSREQVIARPRGAGPNLTVSVRYERDVCAVDESPLGEGIYNARCNLIITVKNVGDTATSMPVNGGFKLNLWYFNYRGEINNGFRYIGNLGVNEEKVITYRSSNLRNFKAATSFTAEVDRGRIITETNENDNRAVFWLM